MSGTPHGLGFVSSQAPVLSQPPSKTSSSSSTNNSPLGSAIKSGFRNSFILTALYAYRGKQDATGKELIRAVDKHQGELLQNIPQEGNILHELVRRGHTRRGLVDIILPRYPVAARAFEWKADGTKVSLLRRAVEKKDRAVIEAIIHATEHLLQESSSSSSTAFGEREDIFLDLLDMEDWFHVLTEYPSLMDLYAVKHIFSLQASSPEVVSDEQGWRAHIGPSELKIQGSEVPFPVNFWPTAINQKLPSILSRQTIRMIATPRTAAMGGGGMTTTATMGHSRGHVVNGDYYGSFGSIDHSRYQHIQPEATGVEVEAMVIGFPEAMKPGPHSLLQLCCDLCERTGRTTPFELEIVAAVLQYKWNAFGRPIYKFCLVVSTLLAINYSLSSAYLDPMLRSHHPTDMTIAYVWQALLWLNGVPLLFQEALQINSQGVLAYFSEAWNVLDVLSLVLVYSTTVMRFFLEHHNAIHLAYHLLSAFAALLLWAKLLAYLRGFHETGALIRMIFQILYDMRYFLVVLTISIVGFGNCLFLIFRHDIESSSSTSSTTITPIKHSYGSLFHTFLVLFFALNSNLDYEPFDASSNKILTAVIYVCYCMTTTILLLNLLIAIMSDSYDKVQEHATAQGRYEQALAIMEIESMLSSTILEDERFFPRWVQVLRARRTGEAAAADADRWSGRIRQISKKIDASEVKLATQIDSLEARLAAFDARICDHLGLSNTTAARPADNNTLVLGNIADDADMPPSPQPHASSSPPSLRLSSEEKKAAPDGRGGNGGDGGGGGGGLRAVEAKVDALERKIDLILAKLQS